MSSRLISPEQISFLRYQLGREDARLQKTALQTLSLRHRSGLVLPSDARTEFERTICGLVLSDNQDLKVARWCLNVLALFGRRDVSGRYVENAAKQYEQHPEIVAAAAAAMCKMHAGRLDELAALNAIDPQIRTLAALQNTDPKKLNLSGFRIDIEAADDEILKLALITVGLNRDIQYLFHPRCGNHEFVRKLGRHPNSIVMQYSAWAVIENKKLSILDLGVPLDRIEDLPPNVQSKVLQAIAELETDHSRRHSFIIDGPAYPSIDAREGLSKGLRHQFYDGLEGITIDWFDQESHGPTREHLAEHFGRYASSVPAYENKALEVFESSPELQRHLLLGAEGTGIYGKLRALRLGNGTFDLFDNPLNQQELAQLREMARPLGKKEMKMKKVLLLAASPENEARLRVDQECRDLEEKLALVTNKRHEVTVRTHHAVRIDQIQDHLLNAKPNILHFSGHGDVGKIIFEDNLGQAAEVDSAALAAAVELHQPYLECVVLNCCFSSSVASQLRAHVSAVVGCTGGIADHAAIAFSRAFYRALAHGLSYQEAFKSGVAEVKLVGLPKEAAKYSIV